MITLWFLYSDRSVSGPYTTAEIEQALTQGHIPEESLIWRRGQREWMAIDRWSAHLDTAVHAQDELWYIENLGKRRGPLTQTELIDHLGTLRSFESVRLWTNGMSKWNSVYEMHEIMHSLGISRRKTERAPLTGQIRINLLSDAPQSSILRAASIGAGGLGAVGGHGLSPGDRVSIVILSSDLGGALPANGQIQYLAQGNYVGVQFLQPAADLVSAIGDHVQRFTTTPRAVRRTA